VSNRYFGTTQSQGRKIQVSTFRDTVLFTVAAVYRDYPHNAHEEFSCFLRFDSSALASLHFDPGKAGIYGKLPGGNFTPIKSILDKLEQPGRWSYRVQPISEIYFGPRVNGEDARHGDRYSIIILISVAALILFLSLTSFVNLTILTLPYRSKELAIKKLAGKSQPGLTIGLAGEYGWITGISLILGVLLLVLSSGWMKSILEVDIVVLFLSGDLSWVLLLLGLFLIFAIAPLFFTLRFTRASPIRLLGREITSSND
jgi:putative ABC transport system permease protein